MIDIIYLGNSAGCKTCYNKGCACSQVGSGNGCAHKLAHALDNCHTALNGNICAHSPEFVHVSETVVEYLIGNDAGTLRQTKKCGYLGLHICGETGVRHSLYAGLYQRSVNGDPNAVVIFLNVNASFAVIDSRCLGITFFTSTFPLVAAAATIYVPASIWSGIIA